MNTVYGKILLWCFITLIASMVALTGLNIAITMHHGDHGPGSVTRLLMEEAVEAYRTGGPAALQAELARIDRHLSDHHYLVDAQGKDLASGEDRSSLIAEWRTQPTPIPFIRERRADIFPTADGQYRFVVKYDTEHFDMRATLPYHALLLIAIAVLCGFLAANLASPLRRLAQAVDRFGAGDLSVRVNSTRKDEIGEVSRAFDRMAERLSTLLTAERRLLQDISHELRSPLARLSFAAELVRTAPDRDTAVARLNKEIARLTDLVGGLIQVTRAEGDASAKNTEILRGDQVLGSIVEDCRMEADQHQCKIAYDAGSVPALSLYGDREVLRRAIENVLRNAIRYTPAGSAIEVVLAATGPRDARISIRDYGPGVPAEALSKIFQPFFRLDGSRDTSTGGVGLGLAIAHRAVMLHHGRLWAENAGPGLRVWIELPLA